eukprot:8298949-Pyramimonas_sp.AAC.1
MASELLFALQKRDAHQELRRVNPAFLARRRQDQSDSSEKFVILAFVFFPSYPKHGPMRLTLLEASVLYPTSGARPSAVLALAAPGAGGLVVLVWVVDFLFCMCGLRPFYFVYATALHLGRGYVVQAHPAPGAGL